MLAMTAIAGLGRLPQVTMPLTAADGVPVGVSLLAAAGNDEYVLSVCGGLWQK